MRTINTAASLKAALRVVCLLPFAAAFLFGQQQVNLTAGASHINLPDGSTVPMWGYTCAGSTPIASSTATCAALNGSAGSGWSPVVITVPTSGGGLTINLTNNLSFNNGNKIPTSLVIVGQLGGGLGTSATTAPSPTHAPQTSTTWQIVNPAGTPFTPPKQQDRVQSFATEVAAGATKTLTWSNLKPGTYLLESGTHPSIQGPMGLYGIVVVTTAPVSANLPGVSVGTAGTAYPNVTYDAEVPLLMSEIDPVQNSAVSAAVNTSGFNETAVWSGQPGGCGNPSSSTYQTCYPPAVNYTPLYYLFNGIAFDKTNAAQSLFSTNVATISLGGQSCTGKLGGQVLVRFVNAGLRMHVPSIVGSTTGASATAGFTLIAEDGNPLPGTPRVQSEVFMAAGKTYDVMINAPASGSTALPVFDRELSLSGGKTQRDAGMLAYLGINGAGLPQAAAFGGAQANHDSYSSVVPGNTLTISDPARGVIANDVNVYKVAVTTAPTHGTVTLSANGTFTYLPSSDWTAATPVTSDSFTYQANGSGPTATVTLSSAPIEAGGITLSPTSYTSPMATYLAIRNPGVLSGAKDAAGYPLQAVPSSVVLPAGSTLKLNLDPNGGFTASVPQAGTYTFTFQAKNSQGTMSASPATVTLTFPPGSGLQVNVVDGKTLAGIPGNDYRWVIEEDRTYYVDPTKTTNTGGSTASTVVPTLGTNFHTSTMPFVAQGCTGPVSCEGGQSVARNPVVCDMGNGACRPDTTGNGFTAVDPSQVVLDPAKRYYISVLPGDAANSFNAGNTKAGCPTPNSCGHTMGGAPITFKINNGQPVTVLVQQNPLPPGKLSVFVFEDDFPLNGEMDAGGGTDVLAPNEPGLGGFQIHLWDAMAKNGDFTGQMTYDMFNMPLTNSLAGTPDPANHNVDACPISQSGDGITGIIITCPKYEADGKTPSPLAGQAVIANLMPGRFGVIATPGADRIARGEEWLQTNTLDGQKAHDVFTRIGEPSYFQEYGPAGYHVAVGFANPGIINSRKAGVCNGTDLNISGPNCSNTVKGTVTTVRMSRTPDERLYSSGSHDSFSFSQCYVSIGDPDGEDFAFTKCAADGTFTLTGIPDGQWRVTVFDQWNDGLVDGLSTPVGLTGGATSATTNMGDIAINQWQANLYTRTFIDDSKTGVPTANASGIPLIPVAIRLRDGSVENFSNTDFTGTANFNETFPLFNWYVVETDTTRYKTTGTHVVYDAGGPADGSASCGDGTKYPKCGGSNIGKFLANTFENNPVPANLRVPGAVYCANADCSTNSIQDGPGSSAPASSGLSTGRIDPPWVTTEGFQGFAGQNNFIEFGKAPYEPGENGGIKGHVVYASTRPFDDPMLLVQTQWEPLVPNVTMNLYQEGTAPDGTQSLTLVDTTQTSSFDDWAQGFRSDGVPNMNCPGQSTADLFYFSLQNQPNYLDYYYNGTAAKALPNNSQYKCYDGMHNWNQVQPAPYDGMYRFPSIAALDPANGKPTGGTNSKVAGTYCSICVANPTDGTPMLPAGKYVVEVVVPPGYELVKEEDKNILIGDNFIAPAAQEFAGLGNIFIMPDQAEVASSYNANNAQNPTDSLGATPINGIVPGFLEPLWPCVGEARTVPDYISLFPGSNEVAPFAGATRNLCDRKEVTLGDQMGATAKFYVYTSTHIAAKFTGIITDDFTSEFDPFSPQFGEKFSPPDLPVSVKDWTGAEISRVYADHWGSYDGLQYSSWEVNPPNPTGYAPTMAVMCMNDAGSGTTPDPLFNPGYSQFCYELPFMPGNTSYLDTPVVPTSAFSEGYNHPDCAYPAATPAINEVDGDGKGPWVSAPGHSLTITSLTANGDVSVTNHAYAGPSATSAPFNQKTVTRHYGFGGTAGTVSIGGVNAPVTAWNDGSITVTVPSGVPACAIQQQAVYSGAPAQCGQLQITTAAGQQSIDAVTVTVGGKAPTYVTGTIQSAIDAAAPGDLIMVPPGVYNEMIIMWKPVRLQGVGAASTVINASTHPAGKMDPWRREVVCLFGLAMNGTPSTYGATGTGSNPYDPSGTYACGTNMNYFVGAVNNPQVDRLPLEAIVGWDASLNGNLAEQLQEPSLMGAFEGAGITVVSKGVKFPNGQNPFASDTFPTGTALLTANDCLDGTGANNPYPSSFWCNPSAIDGLSVTNSSQGGGAIFVHGWGHNIQIANNRLYNNIGTLSGGINLGQGEFPPGYYQGDAANAAPGSCETSSAPNAQLPYCFDMYTNVHNNSITLNSSIGDELFSATPAGSGGADFCNGADYYKFNYNWVCGNMSTGDGGGFGHIGFIKNGDIEHNTFLFNQSLNPTISANGGAIVVMGTPDTDAVCGAADADCPEGLSDGTGPGLLINANLIQGNAAESGSGGGIRLQGVNGSEVVRFPTQPDQWYGVTITNNIINNNVAGWDGGGISLQDAMKVDIINNTIMSNDSTASAGPLFNTLGAPLAGSPNAPLASQTSSTTTSAPQPAGLASTRNSSNMATSLGTTTLTCPAGHPNCAAFSNPRLANNLIWQNRSFYIGVSSQTSSKYQQNVVALYNSFTGTPAASQPSAAATTANGSGHTISGGTGACDPSASYWDIGVRGDSGPSNHAAGTMLPTYTILTDAGDYPDPTNQAANPSVLSQYCNGSRTPPEFGGSGFQVPPGISDATVPNPIFNLTPAATVDEGNNWVNMSWGPLAMTSPAGTVLGNYIPAQGSPAIDAIPTTSANYALAPATDFFGNARPDGGSNIDIGAVEFQAPQPVIASINVNSGPRGYTTPIILTGTNMAGVTGLSISGTGITVSNLTATDTSVSANLNIAVTAPLGPVTIKATAANLTSNGIAFTVVNPPPATLTSISPAAGGRGKTVPFTISGTSLQTAIGLSGLPSSITLVGALSPQNDTTVTGALKISSTASIGTVNIGVNTITGPSTNTVVFNVLPPPTFTSISPNSGARGTNVPVTLTGTGFTGATSLNVLGATGITANSFSVVSDTQATATLSISSLASPGLRNLNVTAPGGTSNNVTFNVTNATLASISPNSGETGTSVPVTLTGAGLTGAMGINVNGANGVSVGSFTVVNSTTITATFTIQTNAPRGTRNINVQMPGGTTNNVPFTVYGPTLASISPASGVYNTSVPVTLTGTNLGGAVAITAGNGISATIGTVTATSISATFNIGANAAAGARNVTVITASNGNTPTTNPAVTFTVIHPALNTISPNSGLFGTTVPVTLSGVNLTGATAVNVSGTGITVSGLTVASNGTSATANFAIAAGALANTRTVSITTPNGTTNTVNFTVRGPTLATISPASGLRGTTVSVTLSGTNFTAASTSIKINGGTGLSVTNLVVTNSTTITAKFVISSSASLGNRSIIVATPNGTSNSMPFKVQ